MANRISRLEAKEALKTGDIPDENDFSNIIDSVVWHDDSIVAPPQKATSGVVTIAQDDTMYMTALKTKQMIGEQVRLANLSLLEQDVRALLGTGLPPTTTFTITGVTIVQVANLLTATVVVSNPNNLVLQYSLDNVVYQNSNVFAGLNATNTFYVKSGTRVESFVKIQTVTTGQVACAADLIIVAVTLTNADNYDVEFYGVDIQEINYQIQNLQGQSVRSGTSGALTSAHFIISLAGLAVGNYQFVGTPTNCNSADLSKRTKVFSITGTVVPPTPTPTNDTSFVEPAAGVVIYNNDGSINDTKMKLVISGNNQNVITDEKWAGRETMTINFSTTRRRLSDNFVENTVIQINLVRAYSINEGHFGANTFSGWKINQPLVSVPLLSGLDYMVRIAYIYPTTGYERPESDGWAYQEPSYWTVGIKNPVEQIFHAKEI